jgi:D-xylose transport system substrate-binding protein
MANAVITALKIQHLAGKVLVTGQDASIPGIQNIMTGFQAMTVYKAISKEAQGTADVVKALYNGQAATTVATTTTKEPVSGVNIPTLALTPVAVDKTNIQSTILADNFWTKAQICANLPAGTDNIC